MTWLTFVIAVLATYRAALMVTSDEGPFNVFLNLRESFPHKNKEDWIGKGLRCLHCMSFWAALPVMLLLVLVAGWDAWLWPIWWFGLSGGAILVDKVWKR